MWRTPIEGGLEAKVLDRVVDWTVAKAGIYFIAPPDQQRRHNICFQEFASGKIRTIGTTDRPISIGMAVSPDSRTLLYSQWDEYGSDLMLVPNFR